MNTIASQLPTDVAALVSSFWRALRLAGFIWPSMMKFGLSEGVVLAAPGEGPGILLPSQGGGAQAGIGVK